MRSFYVTFPSQMQPTTALVGFSGLPQRKRLSQILIFLVDAVDEGFPKALRIPCKSFLS